jgi:SPX domain protein involved in polyphosphate accumulation
MQDFVRNTKKYWVPTEHVSSLKHLVLQVYICIPLSLYMCVYIYVHEDVSSLKHLVLHIIIYT